MSTRPQVGIDRLPARRQTNEPRESMNCKSCRKRKIKCNRIRPTCEACQVFACPCVYDAVPKKRGPKTDVLEALLKRVDGLEKQLHNEKKANSPDQKDGSPQDVGDSNSSNGSMVHQAHIDIPPPMMSNTSQLLSPSEANQPTPSFVPDMLLDTYFSRMHGRPYYIIDETTTRQRLQSNTIPSFLAYAIYAVSARYASHVGGYNNAVRIGHEYARRARMEIDIDEPSIENLQTLLLLAQASHQSGKGKKTYMLLSSAISMAFALDLHRELPLGLKISQAEREGRRRLFWACYLMDRFSVCGSKRPSLISDETLNLRLPSWQLHPGAIPLEGEHFPNGSNIQYMAGSGKGSQGSSSMLIGIVRILGITNRYLAAGGVKGDSHFPWHQLSNLSKIRQELDIWASETQDTFASLEALFGQPDSAMLVLSKLIYHLIHCLIYRPFLPVDLAELSGTSQHQSWQIEATNLCFLHANAIAELVEIGRASSILDWPAFVAYCICTAGTIHVHGAHYRGREGEVFSASSEFLSREMHQLSELRFVWAGAQHQRDTLQTIYGCHSELVKSLASNPLRFAPVFQLEDFFDRYPGQAFDGSHITFMDVTVDGFPEGFMPYSLDQQQQQQHNPYFNQRTSFSNMNGTLPSSSSYQQSYSTQQQQQQQPHHQQTTQEPRKKRRATNPSSTAPKHDLLSAPQPESSTTPSSLLTFANLPNPHLVVPSDFPTGLTPPPFSPSFHFTPRPAHAVLHDPSAAPDSSSSSFDASIFAMDHSITGYEQQPTPGAASASGSTHTDSEKDPFLSLLEQLAENDVNRGGPSELDFFINAAARGAEE
ncbi:hypothetical protein EJ05DRAFT_309185 [Pseudovirgaria hyperparasitica]|uniref:Zn(2)-C6 fungal-type domain-containing protein n=1 Tax=Pseudovirgaria hyperparasitica TaxID=470096 RepID=A0A6A6WC77_9PEZI|nr:uncharacterized protein EJ05DRAFT_309185 [Pseudovirgaria hyperparasitica]KAF2759779.1 hypothetical protein EJ05DRAFT_309185 [Pseudovirgaria hyperparasitica]